MSIFSIFKKKQPEPEPEPKRQRIFVLNCEVGAMSPKDSEDWLRLTSESEGVQKLQEDGIVLIFPMRNGNPTYRLEEL